MIRTSLLLVIILISGDLSHAQFTTPDGDLPLSADDMRQNRKEGTITLRGNVKATINGQSLSCDEAVIYFREKKIIARGNIVLISTNAYMEGTEIVIDYANDTGVVRNGFVRIGQITLEGELVSRTSKTTYEVINGSYTPCETCPPAWGVSGAKVKAEVGGFAHIQSSVLRIGGVPVFWLPYLVVPLMNKRQTGFLFPDFTIGGNSGLTLSEDFFWAMTDSSDSTWTLTHYERRGFKGKLNYRYLLSESSGGEFDASYMKDRFAANNEPRIFNSRPKEEGDLTRYRYRYRHHYELPEGYINDVDINLVSDTLYPKDFPDEMPGYATPALENRMSLTKNSDQAHTSIDLTIYQSLMESNPIHDNSNAVHRFPELNHTLIPTRIGSTSLFFDYNINYANFTRKGPSYDDADPTDGSEFAEGLDTIRTGQRFKLNPRLSAPFDIGRKLEIIPSLTYQESHYQFDVGENPSAMRKFLRTDLEGRTRFSAVFGGQGLEDSRYRHEIIPVIRYTNVPWVFEDKHSFFESEDDFKFYKQNQPIVDGDLIQFDYDDRLINRNIMTIELINNLILRQWNGRSGEYSRPIHFKLSQSYDFFEAMRTDDVDRRPWSELEALLDVRLKYFETSTQLKYFPYERESSVSTRIRAKDYRGDFLEVEYLQDFNIQEEDKIETLQRSRDITWRAGFITGAFHLGGEISYSMITGKEKTHLYRVRVNPPGNCWAVEFTQRKDFDSDPTYNIGAIFLFDGTTETKINQ